MSVDADKEDKPIDRLAFFFIGGLTGLGYGVVLALLHALITNSFHVSIILWSTFVFACLGIFYGDFIIEAILSLIYFFWGFVNGATDNEQVLAENRTQKHLRAFMLIGFATGLIFFCRWRFG